MGRGKEEAGPPLQGKTEGQTPNEDPRTRWASASTPPIWTLCQASAPVLYQPSPINKDLDLLCPTHSLKLISTALKQVRRLALQFLGFTLVEANNTSDSYPLKHFRS